MKKSNKMDFPVLTHIKFITRTPSGTLSAPKTISIEAFNSMSGQAPIQWREDIVIDPDHQATLPDLSVNQFPAKGRSYLAKIQEAVTKTIPHLALIYANDVLQYSTMTTKRFAAGELCLVYAGQYFPNNAAPGHYTTEVVDRNEQAFGTVDARHYRGFGGFMASLPTVKKEHPAISSLDDYDYFSVDQNQIAFANVSRMKNFSFNNIPYVVYSNPRPIEPFTLVATNYGNAYFRKHDIVPLLAYANGSLIDTSLYTTKNIEFEFVQGEVSVICQLPRNAVHTVPILSQGLKLHISESTTFFILPDKLRALFAKYPPHSPFIRVEEGEFTIINSAVLSSSLA